jgi:hypothetical protein
MKSTEKMTKQILREIKKTTPFEKMVVEKLLTLPTDILNEDETKDLVAKQISQITGKDEATTRSHVTMFYNKLVFGIERKSKGCAGRKSALQKFVESLSTVKREIGEAILAGKKQLFLNRNFNPAHVTMVAKDIEKVSGGKVLITKKQSKFIKIGTKEFDGKLLNKEKVRVATVEQIIKSSDNTGTILSLPALFELETKLFKNNQLKVKELNVIGCEFNPTVQVGHNKRIKQIRKALKKIKYLSGRVLDILETPIGTMIKMAIEGNYAHAILDYCGNITTYKNEIKLALDKKIVKVGGIIMVTCTKYDRLKSGVNAINDLLELANGNKNYKIEEIEGEKVFEYTDIKNGGKHGTAMVAMIVRRIK